MSAIDPAAVDTLPTAARPRIDSRVDSRVVGYDLARCFAFLGMVVVNYRFVMGGWYGEPDWLLASMDVVTLRAAATFVMLAGVGLLIGLGVRENLISSDVRALAGRVDAVAELPEDHIAIVRADGVMAYDASGSEVTTSFANVTVSLAR